MILLWMQGGRASSRRSIPSRGPSTAGRPQAIQHGRLGHPDRQRLGADRQGDEGHRPHPLGHEQRGAAPAGHLSASTPVTCRPAACGIRAWVPISPSSSPICRAICPPSFRWARQSGPASSASITSRSSSTIRASFPATSRPRCRRSLFEAAGPAGQARGRFRRPRRTDRRRQPSPAVSEGLEDGAQLERQSLRHQRRAGECPREVRRQRFRPRLPAWPGGWSRRA